MGALIPYTPAEREMITRLALEGLGSADISRALQQADIGPKRRQETIRASGIYKAARRARHKAAEPEAIRGVAPKAGPLRGTYRCPHHPNDRINLPVVKGYVGEQAHG